MRSVKMSPGPTRTKYRHQPWFHPRKDGQRPVVPAVLIIILLLSQFGTPSADCRDDTFGNGFAGDYYRYAQPGDIIVRPFWTIPHMGLLLDNDDTFDLQTEKQQDGTKHGVIHKSKWHDPERFKDAKFFSVIDSTIPIEHKGQRTTFNELPQDVKNKLREDIVDIAGTYIGRDMGGYSLNNQHCGDATMQVCDKAFAQNDIQVLRYKGPAAFTRDIPGMSDKGLVPCRLRDWFVNDWGTGGVIMDPSEADDKLPRREPPRTLAPGNEAGVSMHTEVKEDSMQSTDADALDALSETVRQSNQDHEQLSWTIPDEEVTR